MVESSWVQKEKAMFGKRLSEYLGFQKVWLVLTAAVGLARLGVSLAGAPDDGVRFLSMNVLLWTGAVYYGVAVCTRRQLQADPAAGVLPGADPALDRRRGDPAFDGRLPEHLRGPGVQRARGDAEPVAARPVAPDDRDGGRPLVLWAVGSLAMWITKKAARRPAVA